MSQSMIQQLSQTLQLSHLHHTLKTAYCERQYEINYATWQINYECSIAHCLQFEDVELYNVWKSHEIVTGFQLARQLHFLAIQMKSDVWVEDGEVTPDALLCIHYCNKNTIACLNLNLH